MIQIGLQVNVTTLLKGHCKFVYQKKHRKRKLDEVPSVQSGEVEEMEFLTGDIEDNEVIEVEDNDSNKENNEYGESDEDIPCDF